MSDEKKGGWDGSISNLRVSPKGHPELYNELSHMHHKERTDRLRSLAMLGLTVVQLSGNMRGLLGSGCVGFSQDLNQRQTGQSARQAEIQKNLKTTLLGSM